MQLTFITPTTLDELRLYRRDIDFLQSFLPFPHWSKEDPEAFLEAVVGELTLVYYDGLLIGSFMFELSKRSAELHGIVRPDLKSLLCPRSSRRLLASIYRLMFDRIFGELGKRAIVAKIPPEARGAKGFLLREGFKQINTEGRDTVWSLSRDKYLERQSVKKAESAEGSAIDSAVGVRGR